MGQCLGHAAGNAVEVHEAVAMLKGEPAHPQLVEVVLALCGEALALAKLAPDAAAGGAAAAAALASGAAAERFARMVAGLGGPTDFMERHAVHLPTAPLVRPVDPPRAGRVRSVDARALGLAVVELGGGRRHADHAVDHAVGLTEVRAIGDEVGPDRPLALIHARDEPSLAAATARLLVAYQIADEVTAPTMIVARIE
jgi:thymidine phosphorylase